MTQSDNWKLDGLLWQDAQLEGVEIGYGSIKLKVLDTSKKSWTVQFDGYIGFSHLAMWDEVVIDKLVLHENHSLLEHCLKEIETNLKGTAPDSGDEYRNLRNPKVVEIEFIDGSSFFIVANRASVYAL